MAIGEPTHSATFRFTDDGSAHTLLVRQTPLATLYRGMLDGEEVILDAGLKELLSHAAVLFGEFSQPKWVRSINAVGGRSCACELSATR